MPDVGRRARSSARIRLDFSESIKNPILPMSYSGNPVPFIRRQAADPQHLRPDVGARPGGQPPGGAPRLRLRAADGSRSSSPPICSRSGSASTAGPVRVDDLRGRRGRRAVDDPFADLDSLSLDLPDACSPKPAPAAACAPSCSPLLDQRRFPELMAAAQREHAAVMADPELQRLVGAAQERMEAEPYVLKFLGSARQALPAGDGAETARLLDKARALDPTHPGLAELDRRRRRRRRPGSLAPAPLVLSKHPLPRCGTSAMPASLAFGGGDSESDRRIRELLDEGQTGLRRRRSAGRDRRLVAHLPDRHRPPGGVAPHRGGPQAQGRGRAPGRGDLPRRRGAAGGRRRPGRPAGVPAGARDPARLLRRPRVPAAARRRRPAGRAEARGCARRSPAAPAGLSAAAAAGGGARSQGRDPGAARAPGAGGRRRAQAGPQDGRRRRATAAAPAASSSSSAAPCCCSPWPGPGSSCRTARSSSPTRRRPRRRRPRRRRGRREGRTRSPAPSGSTRQGKTAIALSQLKRIPPADPHYAAGPEADRPVERRRGGRTAAPARPEPPPRARWPRHSPAPSRRPAPARTRRRKRDALLASARQALAERSYVKALGSAGAGQHHRQARRRGRPAPRRRPRTSSSRSPSSSTASASTSGKSSFPISGACTRPIRPTTTSPR